jgi:tetratricopeptide (TPR) repeat protein
LRLTRPGCTMIAAFCLAAGIDSASAQQRDAGQRPSFGTHELLAAGEGAIRAGRYDDGIRMMTKALSHGPVGPKDRAMALSSLCAAYVAKDEPDQAIEHCTASLDINTGNWRSYANRSRAYLMLGMYAEAVADHDAAAALNPNSAYVRMMRDMLADHAAREAETLAEHAH